MSVYDVSTERTLAYRTVQNRAKSRIRHAQMRGTLVAGTCARASAECRGIIHGHHGDYSRPVDVEWLCALHHREVHSEIGACPSCRKRWVPEVFDDGLRCPYCHADRSAA